MSSRLLEVLFTFSRERPRLSLAEISRLTNVPHPTARRLLLELTAAGAVVRGEDGRYAVGVRLWELGTLAPQTESLRNVAMPFMEDLYATLHQHVQLAVLEGDMAVVLERLSAPDAEPLLSHVGGRLPLHCTGVGKVLLSHANADLVEQILQHPLRRYTERTITDPKKLRAQIAACRRTGIATVREELTVGDSVATRIVDGDGSVVAALSVVVRRASVKHQAALSAVVTSALGISRQLGWRPGVHVRNS